jgi:AraC family transcriptional regulator
MAAIARLSVYYLARQFKRTTGLPPHQYVILRRVERARELVQARTHLSLAEVALSASFSDQSQFTRHFKRVVGLTPRQFRAPQESPKSRKSRQEIPERPPYHSP